MTIQIASAPVSWGIYEFEGIAPKYPYTRVLDEIKDTGYTGIELGPYGYLPTDPDVLRTELTKRGLQLLSAFVPVKLVDPTAHEAGAQAALKVGKLLAAVGAKFIVLADDNGSVPELVKQAGQRSGSKLTASEWDVFAQGVNLIARRVHDETGLSIAFHHHCAGYVETPDEVREMLKRTDKDLVGLCLDTGHWHYAGGDAVQCVQEYGERVRYLHLKDCSASIAQQCRIGHKDYFEAVKAGVFCPLGEGEVDFPGVIREMEKIGYSGWAIVEQDVLTDDLDAPKQYSQANRDYLKSIGL
ncbi:MAG TPA: TIM barrel protein [Phototrophicaceae bacterium]|jgi:inosose dehydratase|nr:TIM barrel protein [Phototrophicaceae bacterium]